MLDKLIEFLEDQEYSLFENEEQFKRHFNCGDGPKEVPMYEPDSYPVMVKFGCMRDDPHGPQERECSYVYINEGYLGSL